MALDGPPTAPVMIGDRLWFGVAIDEGGYLLSMDPESWATSPGPAVTGGVPTNIAVGFDSVWVGVEWDGAAWLLRLPGELALGVGSGRAGARRPRRAKACQGARRCPGEFAGAAQSTSCPPEPSASSNQVVLSAL